MNRVQKMSWLMVITIGIAVVLSAITVGSLYYLFGFPVAWAGLAFLGLSGLGGLGQAIFKKDPGPVQMDERDREIVFKAHRASMALSYLVFGLLSMGIWGAYHYSKIETISINVLPLIFGAAGLTAFFFNSLGILILYGRDKTFEGETK
jgi:flagellar basal body-associated protein FliL